MMRPTDRYRLFDRAVEVLIYGKQTGDLEEPQITQIASELGVETILRPQTHTFNAIVCEPDQLTEFKTINGITIRSGCLADGVTIPVGQMACLRTADCPTIIVHNAGTGEVIAAHAGRASLINEVALHDHSDQTRPSIVEAICQKLLSGGGRPNAIQATSICGIGPIEFKHPIDHPEYGAFNSMMNHYIAAVYGESCFLGSDWETGHLNLYYLITKQFNGCGVPMGNLGHDEIDTASQQLFYFSRRGGDKTGHNTILVIRRA